MLAIETHEFIKELAEAGLSERQAEIIARHQAAIVEKNLATKHDIEMLKKDLTIKFGVGWVAAVGIILGALSVMLK
ncbi:hypothetical protein [Candidatus Spongiihabitans sp.]|uniref:hypothetical protein n=1 Tax=Candidatus Spongiihabitans sp. TaxID=3101308 RepID=UPI003C7E5640